MFLCVLLFQWLFYVIVVCYCGSKIWIIAIHLFKLLCTVSTRFRQESWKNLSWIRFKKAWFLYCALQTTWNITWTRLFIIWLRLRFMTGEFTVRCELLQIKSMDWRWLRLIFQVRHSSRLSVTYISSFAQMEISCSEGTTCKANSFQPHYCNCFFLFSC